MNTRRKSFLFGWVVLLASQSVRAQTAHNVRTLSITGRAEYVKVLEANRRAYIDVEDLARLMRGSLTFDADRILLTLPSDSAHEPSVIHGFSREFLQALIEQMSDIREWRAAVNNSIQSNAPISEQFVGELQRGAHKNLALAGTVRSTQEDHHCYPLLAAEYSNMQKLSDRFLSLRKQLKYIDPRSADNDPLDRQILACAHSLASMAADNQFHAEPQCTEAR